MRWWAPRPPGAAPAGDAPAPPGDAAHAVDGPPAERTEAYWPCPTCGERNPLALDTCAACGTSFGTLLALEPTQVRVEPGEALRWSLLYPGLGHKRAGLPLDGLARGILFSMTFGMALLMAFGGPKTGVVSAMFVLFVLLSVATYALTALEAYRVAAGGPLFVPSRILLWITVGVMLFSAGAIAVAVTVSPRPTG